MSTIRVGNIGPLTGNTSVIADPGGTGGMSLVSMGAVSASGSNPITFSGIPSWARRITLNFVSLTGGTSSQNLLIQVGTSGGTVTTGYQTAATYFGSAGASAAFTNGWQSYGWYTSTYWLTGTMFFNLVSSNIWSGQGFYTAENTSGVAQAYINWMSGRVNLSGALTSVIITSASGSTAFSGGTVNVMYE